MKNIKLTNYNLIFHNENKFVHPSFYFIRALCGFDNYYNEIKKYQDNPDYMVNIEVSYNFSNHWFSYFYEVKVLETIYPDNKGINLIKSTLDNFFNNPHCKSTTPEKCLIGYHITNKKTNEKIYSKIIDSNEIVDTSIFIVHWNDKKDFNKYIFSWENSKCVCSLKKKSKILETIKKSSGILLRYLRIKRIKNILREYS